MGAIVGPDTPIIVGLTLSVFAVFVIQKGDDLVHHPCSHWKSGAENRPRELQCEVCADALVSDEIFEARTGVRRRVVMKLNAFVDALFDRITHSGVEQGLRQTLTELQIAFIEKLVPGIATQFTFRNHRPTLTPTPCSGSSGAVAMSRQRRNWGYGACSSLQAPLMYMTAWPATPPSPLSLERNWLVAQSST